MEEATILPATEEKDFGIVVDDKLKLQCHIYMQTTVGVIKKALVIWTKYFG